MFEQNANQKYFHRDLTFEVQIEKFKLDELDLAFFVLFESIEQQIILVPYNKLIIILL